MCNFHGGKDVVKFDLPSNSQNDEVKDARTAGADDVTKTKDDEAQKMVSAPDLHMSNTCCILLKTSVKF